MLITVFGVLLSFLSPLGEGAEQGAVRYINYCLWRSAVLFASPRGGWHRAAMTERGITTL